MPNFEWDEHKNKSNQQKHKIAFEDVTDYSNDSNRIKIEALDVMKLAKGGIVVPEEAIYYDDEDIAYDEDFEGDWVRVDTSSQSKSE